MTFASARGTKKIFATLVLFCLVFAAGCDDGRAKVRNWQNPDGKFRMDIPEGWRETSPPQGFFVQFRITCTSLEKHFGSHLAGFQKTCRSFYPKPEP
ncbi:MAG: hypothetical protein ABIH04_06330 [Planctomycetota bacterium]